MASLTSMAPPVILVVEDQPLLRLHAVAMIEDAHGEFDLVFSDVVMPGPSGIDLAREIRARWPELPVVLTSGYSHVLAEEGNHGFRLIQKPYSVKDLAGLLGGSDDPGPESRAA